MPEALSTPHGLGPLFLGLSLIVLAAKLGGELFERLQQPAVLGELFVGILIGHLPLMGFSQLEFLRHLPILDTLAEIGIVLLLFEVGVEATVPQMLRVGPSALAVALLGVVAPSLLGFGVASLFFPSASPYSHAFVGAILCATSVGITARVLQDLGATKTPEAQIILGAAVIDDVLGLIVLATASGMIRAADAGTSLGGSAILWIAAKAFLFLFSSIVLGRWIAPRLFRLATLLKSRRLLLPLSVSFCFLFAALAQAAGLAPIVGAFTAGLILEDVHYLELATRERRSLEEELRPLTSLLLPIFFVLMGLKVDLREFTHLAVLGFAGALTLVALLGKLACMGGVLVKGIDRLTVGLGMIPRGEVGLIFAGIGFSLTLHGEAVVSPAAYSGVVIMVMLTTMVTPPLLKWRMTALRPPPPSPSPDL